MKSISNYIKHHKKFVATLGVAVIIFIFTLIQNFWTQFVSDDWCYLFVYDHIGNPNPASHRVKHIFDVFSSMANHWKLWNGRIVAHGLLQLVFSTSYPGFHKVIFNIINSLMYVLCGGLIYLHGTYKKKNSVLLFLGIYAMMWFFIPQYGATVLWASGAANYLWCAVIILAYLLPYRMYLSNSDNVMKDSWRNCAIMTVLGLFAGCTNENSGGALALMCILFAIAYKINKIKIPKWSFAGIGATIIGAIVLISAPGNYRVSSKATLAELIERGKNVLKISEDLLFPLIMIMAVVLFFVWITNKNIKSDSKYGYLTPIIYFIGAAAAIGVLIFSAQRPERTWFISVCLIIIVNGYLFTEINFKPLGKYFSKAVVSVLALVLAVSYTVVFCDLHDTYEQVREQSKIINNARKENDAQVEIKIVKPSKSKHDYMTYVNDFSTNGNEWQNQWAALYYGLDKITGEE